jgi:hypothetical protein
MGVMALPDAAHPIPQDAGSLATGIITHPDIGYPLGAVVIDAGIMVLPDASVGDAGPTDGGSVPLAAGVVIRPDAGIVVRPDAGPGDGGCNRDASPLLGGIVFAPPDASCMPYYPGVMPRNDQSQ